MRLRASHPKPHRSVDPCAALSPRRRRMIASARLHPEGRAVFRSQLPSRNLAITLPQPCDYPAAFQLRRAERGGGRNDRATSRTCARFWMFSPTANSFESAYAAGYAAIIRHAQELSRFAEPTVSQIVATRNKKAPRNCAEPVDDVSSLWKPEEN